MYVRILYMPYSTKMPQKDESDMGIPECYEQSRLERNIYFRHPSWDPLFQNRSLPALLLYLDNQMVERKATCLPTTSVRVELS